MVCCCGALWSVLCLFFAYLLFGFIWKAFSFTYIRCHILFISRFNHNCSFSCINFENWIWWMHSTVLLLLLLLQILLLVEVSDGSSMCISVVIFPNDSNLLLFCLSSVKFRNQIASSINVVKLRIDVKMTTTVPTKSWTHLFSSSLTLSLSHSNSVHNFRSLKLCSRCLTYDLVCDIWKNKIENRMLSEYPVCSVVVWMVGIFISISN